MKNKFKEKITVGLFILSIVLLCSSSLYVYINHKEQLGNLNDYSGETGNNTIITGEFMEDDFVYETVEYESFEKIDYDQLDDMLPDNDGVYVFISSNTCLFCAQLKPILNEALIELDRKMFIIETDELDDIRKEALGNRFSLESVPTILKITGEEVESGLVGIKTKSEILEWFSIVD